MLSGKRFRLNKETMAIASSSGIKTVPQNGIIKILSGPTKTDSRMVEALWDGQPLIMFVEDIQQRGEEIAEQTA